MRKGSSDDSLRCSFCKKSQTKAGKLISSASDYPRAYICDECVAVCVAIIEDDQAESEPTDEAPPTTEPHPLLNHPLASNLMEAMEIWMREESLGNDGAIALGEVRDIASQMMTAVVKRSAHS